MTLEQIFSIEDAVIGVLDMDGFVYFTMTPTRLADGDHTLESMLVDGTTELRLGYRLGIIGADGEKTIRLLQQQQAHRRFEESVPDRATVTVL